MTPRKYAGIHIDRVELAGVLPNKGRESAAEVKLPGNIDDLFRRAPESRISLLLGT